MICTEKKYLHTLDQAESNILQLIYALQYIQSIHEMTQRLTSICHPLRSKNYSNSIESVQQHAQQEAPHSHYSDSHVWRKESPYSYVFLVPIAGHHQQLKQKHAFSA